MIKLGQYYKSTYLQTEIDVIEDSLNITNEEDYFKNKVNTSHSKNYPYHRWVRYREGYSGDLVKELIRRSNINPQKYFIFDPMCGSGSTQVASAEMGFDSLGLDVNQYAVDLSNAKFEKFNKKDISKIRKILSSLSNNFVQRSISTNIKTLDCKKYFSENNFEQIQFILEIVNSINDDQIRKFLFVAWLAILEDCSERKKDGNGLLTRPSKVADVLAYFSKQVSLMLEDISNHPLSNVTSATFQESATNSCKVVTEYAKKLKKELGAIIFSPPYANSFDYFESYKIELLCGYYNTKELIEARKKAIRNYRKGYGYPLHSNNRVVEELANEVRSKIPEKEKLSGTIDNRSRLVPNLLVGYFEDMEKVIQEFAGCMPKNAKCYIVVDQSSYLGVIIPTDLLLADIARKNGFSVSSLIRCRRAATSGQQLKAYPYLNKTLRESIVVLEKDIDFS